MGKESIIVQLHFEMRPVKWRRACTLYRTFSLCFSSDQRKPLLCVEGFAGNPNFTLYWMYNIDALREIIGMSEGKFRLIKSNLGQFLRRVPSTAEWVASVPWLGSGRNISGSNRSQLAARGQHGRKTYVNCPPDSIKYNT